MQTRRQRREEARSNKTNFVPQYNFSEKDVLQDNGQPLISHPKSFLKDQRSKQRREEKLNKNKQSVVKQ